LIISRHPQQAACPVFIPRDGYVQRSEFAWADSQVFMNQCDRCKDYLPCRFWLKPRGKWEFLDQVATFMLEIHVLFGQYFLA
jgi:hypothetical protein